MKTKHTSRSGFARPIALFTTSAILVPTLLAGCSGNKTEDATPAPMDRSTTAPPPAKGSAGAPKAGLTTKQKMVALAGAAALYYVYRKYQNSKSASGVQYYQSKANGRIYYRDPKNPKQAIYVTPPAAPVMVPESEASQYQGYAGYNNQATGNKFGGYGYEQNGAYQGEPNSVPAPTM